MKLTKTKYNNKIKANFYRTEHLLEKFGWVDLLTLICAVPTSA